MTENERKCSEPKKLVKQQQWCGIINKDIMNSVKQNIMVTFETFTGHNFKLLTSFNDFTEFMYKPTDAASIGVGRMLFGLMMLFDIPEERSGADLDYRWGDPKDCRFPLLPFLKPLSLPRMGILYFLMWFGALGITIGYKFKISCMIFLVPYWYIFLLDKSSWNNHSYLYGLVGILFSISDAHRYCSIDAWKNPKIKAVVPFWNYFLLKYQFFILYFVAGLKKMCSEWLSGYAMTNLSYHWVFSPFRLLLGAEMTDLLIIHWFGCFFDLLVAFFLIYENTRPLSTLFAIGFHLMNSRLFTIGMFPWVCLAEIPLFYKVNWPRVVLNRLSLGRIYPELSTTIVIADEIRSQPGNDEMKTMTTTTTNDLAGKSTKKKLSPFCEKSKSLLLLRENILATDQIQQRTKDDMTGITLRCRKENNSVSVMRMKMIRKLSCSNLSSNSTTSTTTSNNDTTLPCCDFKFSKKNLKRKRKIVVTFILIYCSLQAFLPYSHFITKGYNNWTNGLYGYSWDMMVHAWDTVLIAIKIVDNDNGNVHFLEPYAFSETDRWTKHADMAIQYAKCIEKNLENEMKEKNLRILSSMNFSIYFDVWCSLNGRFQQRFYNPTVDLLRVDWSPFTPVSWVLPLLREFTHLRPKLDKLTEEVLSWNNYSDVMFIADFPDMIMENYISPDLDNVTLTILDGEVKFEEDNNSSHSTILKKGQSIHVKSDIFHRIITISDYPSSYMYSYVNKSMISSIGSNQFNQQNQPPQIPQQTERILPILDEINNRWENYKKFFAHVANSILFEFYGVPMPRRLKDIS